MKKIVITIFCFGCIVKSFSQNIGISTDGSTPEAGVMLDIKGTNTYTAIATQNVFQVKSYDANALKLRMILGNTSTAATSAYAGIEVYDAVNAAYRPLALQPSGGNVGIGTTSSSYKLQIDQTGDVPFLLLNTTSATNKRTRLQFGQSGTLNWEFGTDAGLTNTDNIYFYNRLTSTFGPVILNNGNTGIGNTNPTEKLHVTGNIRFSGALMPNNSAGTSGQVLTSAGAGSPPTWSNPAAGTMILLYNNETSVSGFTYANTTAFSYNVAGTFSQVKVEADIENDCSGGADVSLQGWDYKIVYNGVTKRTAQLLCGDKANNDDWLSGHVTYMGAAANGQTVKIDVINVGTAGTWYVRNFRVWGIY